MRILEKRRDVVRIFASIARRYSYSEVSEYDQFSVAVIGINRRAYGVEKILVPFPGVLA